METIYYSTHKFIFVWALPLQCRVVVPATYLWRELGAYLFCDTFPTFGYQSAFHVLSYNLYNSTTDLVLFNSIYLYKGFCLPPKMKEKETLHQVPKIPQFRRAGQIREMN